MVTSKGLLNWAFQVPTLTAFVKRASIYLYMPIGCPIPQATGESTRDQPTVVFLAVVEL